LLGVGKLPFGSSGILKKLISHSVIRNYTIDK